MSDASHIIIQGMPTQDQPLPFTPLTSLTTKELEDTPFELIVNSNLDELDCRFTEIDEYSAGAEEHESDFERRGVLCR